MVKTTLLACIVLVLSGLVNSGDTKRFFQGKPWTTNLPALSVNVNDHTVYRPLSQQYKNTASFYRQLFHRFNTLSHPILTGQPATISVEFARGNLRQLPASIVLN